MVDSNVFVLTNLGKIQVYVDGKIIEQNEKTKIFDKSVIEVILNFNLKKFI